MKIIKLSIPLLFALLFVSCSTASQPNKSATPDNTKIERNKQTAILNEVGETVRDAQSIEKLGRNMDSYRLALDAESKRTCNTVMEDNRRELADLEARIKHLPGSYQDQLTAIVPDLNECVSCSKNAMDSCVKARASVNKIIKEIYP
jgi:hypothetical protein